MEYFVEVDVAEEDDGRNDSKSVIQILKPCLKTAAFWHLTPCSVAEVNRRVEHTASVFKGSKKDSSQQPAGSRRCEDFDPESHMNPE
jgi:hypothetical protein